MTGPTIVKLGGSVITDKTVTETLDEDALARAAEAIAGASGPLAVVHGAGSFGHVHADRHGVTPTEGTEDAIAAYEIHDSMRRLNDAVIDRLHECDVRALPVHPLSAGARSAGDELTYPALAEAGLLGEGFVPVAHGDVIAHGDRGVTIVSGDEIVVRVAQAVDAARVGLCSSVPGVLDDDGAVISRIDSLSAVEDVLGGSDATDVTGGMAAKVRVLCELDAPASVFGLDGLASFLEGGTPGTLIE